MPAGPAIRVQASPVDAGYAERTRDPLAEIRERQRACSNRQARAAAVLSSAAMPAAPARTEQRTGTRREDDQPAVATRVAEANQRRADIREFTGDTFRPEA